MQHQQQQVRFHYGIQLKQRGLGNTSWARKYKLMTVLIRTTLPKLTPTRNNWSFFNLLKMYAPEEWLEDWVCLIFIQERKTQVWAIVMAGNYLFWFLQRCKPPCSRGKPLPSAVATGQSCRVSLCSQCLGPVKLGPSQAHQADLVPHLSKPSPCNADICRGTLCLLSCPIQGLQQSWCKNSINT